MKNETIVCIFAHPDDEAFGPAGTIAKWALKNNVYLICVTDGSHPNSGIHKLAQIRKKELEESVKILGVKEIFYLGYTDGELRNNIYHKVAEDVEKILLKLKPATLLTFESRGVTGHIDHVFVSMVTCFLFRKLKFVKNLYFWALHKAFSNEMQDYFIYCPDGYTKEKVDYTEDITSVWDLKLKAVTAHVSQKKDGDFFLKLCGKLPKEELFFVKKK